jgi:hypothetical protein
MLLPRGCYKGQLIAIDTANQRTWTFEVVYQGRKYGRKCFSSDKPYGKTKQYAEALLGRELEKGEEIDLSDRRGFSGDVDVGVVTKNGREYNSIENMI